MSLTISSIIGLILSQVLGDSIPTEKISNFVEVAGLIIFGAMAWYGRIRAGGVDVFGRRK